MTNNTLNVHCASHLSSPKSVLLSMCGTRSSGLPFFTKRRTLQVNKVLWSNPCTPDSIKPNAWFIANWSCQELCLHSARATELAFCVSCIESVAEHAGKPISCDGQYPAMAHILRWPISAYSCTVSCSSCSILEALESHELSQRLSERRLLCRLLDNCNRQSFIMSLHHSVQQATFLQ